MLLWLDLYLRSHFFFQGTGSDIASNSILDSSYIILDEVLVLFKTLHTEKEKGTDGHYTPVCARWSTRHLETWLQQILPTIYRKIFFIPIIYEEIGMERN